MNTRRNFLRIIAGSVTFLFLTPISYAKKTAKEKVKKVALPISKIKALKEIGGFSIVEVKDKALLLVRNKNDTVKVLDATCTHQGCAVEYNRKVGKVACPCHGSEFSLDGKVLKGPATKPLKLYRSRLSGDRVIIEL